MTTGERRDDERSARKTAKPSAFWVEGLGKELVPVLIAVPHAGRDYPADVLAAMRDPAGTPGRLEDRHADALGEQLARSAGAALVVASAPRAMIDLNRAPDDVDWSMIAGATKRRVAHSSVNRRARGGLGLVPRRLPGAGEIWRGRLSERDLAERIASIHQPYHASLAKGLEAIRDRWGAALLLDLHSMPPLSGNGTDAAPEFVVGDRFGASCHQRIVGRALHHIGASGRKVAHNRPYSGGYSLDRHAAPRRGIQALQIEVCRASYLDAALDRPSARMAAVVRLLSGLVRALADEVTALGNPHLLKDAAE